MGAALVIPAFIGVAAAMFSKSPSKAPPHVQAVAQVLSTPPQQEAPKVVKTEEMIIREAREKIGVDCMKYYNFGVSGQSGVGKSSLINGILSLQGNAACAVGEVETTQQIRSYSCKKWPSLKLWDIPGAGTANHPAATYFEDKHLYVFDTILILTADRFLDVDLQVLRSANKFKTPCVFVRTKCDIAVESRARRDHVNALEASKLFKADVSRNFNETLAKAGQLVAPPLYFISYLSLSGEDAYSIYDRKQKAVDCSLPSMDEQALTTFLLEAAKKRA